MVYAGPGQEKYYQLDSKPSGGGGGQGQESQSVPSDLDGLDLDLDQGWKLGTPCMRSASPICDTELFNTRMQSVVR